MPTVVFAPKGISVLIILSVLVSLLIYIPRFNRKSVRLARPSVLFLCIAGLAIFSSAWSITPQESFWAAVSFSALIICGNILAKSAAAISSEEAAKVLKGAAMGGVLGFVLLAIELLGGGQITQQLMHMTNKPMPTTFHHEISLRPGLIVASLYFWPWLVSLRRAFPKLWIHLSFFGALVILISGSSSAIVAFIGGAFILALFWGTPKFVRISMTATIILLVTLAPLIYSSLPDPTNPKFILVDKLSHSGIHRLVIWRTTVSRISENPIIGFGFDTSRALYGDEDKVTLRFRRDDPALSWINSFPPIPLHPHNNVLQVWLEFGLVGALFLTAVLTCVLLKLKNSGVDRLRSGIGYALFTSLFMVSLISFGAWQSWWLSTVFLLAALYTAGLSNEQTDFGP